MKTIVSLGLLCIMAATAHAQTDTDRNKPLGEDTLKVSDHVWGRKDTHCRLGNVSRSSRVTARKLDAN